MFNLRLSKMGGITAAGLHQAAAEARHPLPARCHVGETSILAAAGRHFAFTQGPLAYLEGSFPPSSSPGTRWRCRWPSAGAAGLALGRSRSGDQVEEAALDEMAVSRLTLS